MKARSTIVLLLAMIAVSAAWAQPLAKDERASFDEKSLRGIYRQIYSVVLQNYPSSLDKPSLRLVSTNELYRILQQQLHQQKIYKDEWKRPTLERLTEFYSQVAVVHATSAKELLVNVDNFYKVSLWSRQPKMSNVGFVAIALIHQLVQICAAESYDISTALSHTTGEEYYVFRALVEGHIRFHAYDIARQLDIVEYYWIFNKYDKAIKTGAKITKYAAPGLSSPIVFSYIAERAVLLQLYETGYEVFANLDALHLEDYSRKVFASPPKTAKEMSDIGKICENILQSSLPDFNRKKLRETLHKEGFAQGMAMDFDAIDLQNAFAQEKQEHRVFASFHRGVVFLYRGKNVVIAQFRNKAAATTLFAMEAALIRKKDRDLEQLQRTFYDEVPLDNGKLLLARKILQSQQIASALVLHENYFLQVNVLQDPPTNEELQRVCVALMTVLVRK